MSYFGNMFGLKNCEFHCSLPQNAFAKFDAKLYKPQIYTFVCTLTGVDLIVLT